MKGELKSSIYVALEGAGKIFFQGALKVAQKCEEKNIRRYRKKKCIYIYIYIYIQIFKSAFVYL